MTRLRRASKQPVGIAFLPGGLLVATVSGRWTRVPLPADAVRPSPTEENLASPADAARALRAALRRLGISPARLGDAVLALPDRAVHAGLGAPFGPGRGGRSLRRLRAGLIAGLGGRSGAMDEGELDARFRFGSLLSGSFRRRTALGAVSGSRVVRQYEAVAEAAGLTVRWVDAASLAVLPEWLAGPASASRVLLLLHRRHFVLAATSVGLLSRFRMKLRAALDPAPPVQAVRLLPDVRAPVEIRGAGSGGLAEALDQQGYAVRVTAETNGAEPEGPPPIEAGALQALLARIGARSAPLAPRPESSGGSG